MMDSIWNYLFGSSEYFIDYWHVVINKQWNNKTSIREVTINNERNGQFCHEYDK